MLKAAIFDLDGVIVNTVPLHFKAWKKMFNEYGNEFTFEDYKEKVDGIPRMDGARAILTKLSQEELEKAATKKQSYFLEFLNSDSVDAYRSTINLIDGLKSKNVKVAVISSSKNCKYILDKIKLTPKLDAIITGNDITKGKPDPQVFLMAAEKVNASPSTCVVFEDAVLGVEAAKKGGMFCVGIDRYDDKVRLGKADIIVSDLSELTAEGVVNFLKGENA